MRYDDKVVFLEEYKRLCEQYKCYVDTSYGKQLYIHEILYPVDRAFESTIDRLCEDVG